MTAKTANGNIRIGDASRGTLRLETSVGELEVGIHPGSAAYLDVNAKVGTLQNLMETADQPAQSEETVHVYARSSFGQHHHPARHRRLAHPAPPARSGAADLENPRNSGDGIRRAVKRARFSGRSQRIR